MGFATPADYLHQLIAATLASNETNTYVLEDGTLVCSADLEPAVTAPTK